MLKQNLKRKVVAAQDGEEGVKLFDEHDKYLEVVGKKP